MNPSIFPTMICSCNLRNQYEDLNSVEGCLEHFEFFRCLRSIRPICSSNKDLKTYYLSKMTRTHKKSTVEWYTLVAFENRERQRQQPSRH
ncbi:hypothetical protein Glove_37g82 [Diversispora epigaea]|uniref:Uncharacterized protein n=1 Tax=Diversispora epigaea TaxID=1348612 RepID=A0A397JH03_9GLOM|nr:hypothetical protein Glove_37g82 [Diversispora epigaea]